MEQKIKIKNLGNAPIEAGMNLERYVIPAHGEAFVPVGVYEALINSKADIQVVGIETSKKTIPKDDELIYEPI
jgi:hypothetical protein